MEWSFEPLRLDDSLWLVDTGLYHAERGALVLSDLHLGYEEALRQSGVLLPDTQCEGLLARLARTFSLLGVSPDRPLASLILGGDLRQGFGPLNAAEWRELETFFEGVLPRCRRVVVVAGNHDPELACLLRRFAGVEVARAVRREGWLYLHGHRLPRLRAEDARLVIGHEHPALSLRDPITGRQERYKAFLKGSFRGRVLWVLPSCNALVKGADLARGWGISPLLREAGCRQVEVFLRDDQGQIHAFGALERLIQAGGCDTMVENLGGGRGG